MRGVCEFVVVDNRQQPGLDASEVCTRLEENIAKRRQGVLDLTGSGDVY
jgi:hypothetical protein